MSDETKKYLKWIGKRVSTKGHERISHYIVRGVTSSGIAYLENTVWHDITRHPVNDLVETPYERR